MSSCSQKYLKRSHKGYNDMPLIQVPPLQLTDPCNRPTCRCLLPKKSFSRKDLPCCQRKLKSNFFLFSFFSFNPFTARMSLENYPPPPPQVCNLKFLCSFFLFFTFKLETTSIKMHDIESDTLQDRKIHSLQACECIFLPGNFTDCGSEGVNTQ